MLKNISAQLLTTLVLGLLISPVMADEVVDFSPDTYQYYDQARSLDQSSKVIARAKETRTHFANERFVATAASTGEDNWSELESLWKRKEQNPLWASEQVLREDL